MNIYPGNTSNFENNGYGFLKDCLSATVTNAINGIYELNLRYPRNSNMDEYLIVGNIIKVNVGNNNYQLFRIKTVNKSFDPIQIYAQHIFYDLSDNYLDDVYPQNLNCEAFGNWLLDKLEFDTNFTVYSDITGTKTARYVDKNPVQSFIGDDTSSIINLFNCEIERDNFDITFKDRIGNNNGVKLVIGKNITSINISIDITSLYTKIKPVGYNGLTLPETYVNSPLINNWPTPKICKYEFSDIKYDPEDPTAYQTEEEAYDALRDAAESLFESGIDKPQINIKINWVELSKTKEYYDKYSNIERVSLGDTVYANIEGLDYETRVIKTVYNVLTDSIDSYELGTPQASYASKINSISMSVEEVDPTSILAQAQTNATNQINSAMGGYVYKTNEELFIMDTNNPNTATKVWRWNLNGLGYSSNGINGPYQTAITQDGAIVANFITTGKLNTDVIEGYDQLVAKVNSEISLTNEVSNLKNIELSEAYPGNILYFRIYGEMSLIYPSDDLFPSDDLYPLDSFLIIEDVEGNQNSVHLPLNYLHYLDENIYDEFIVENGQAKIIRRVGESSDGILYELDEQTIEDLGECGIPINSGFNKIWLESFYDEDINYFARYATINDYTDTFATKIEMDSSITLAKNEINIQTEQKIDTATGTDALIAKINLKPGKILLEGTVTANENFKILEDGSIEAVNGSFTGNIYLKDGNVVVGGDGMLTNLKFSSTGVYDGKSFVGFRFDTEGGSMSFYKTGIALNFIIPDNFTVTNAYVTLAHSRVNFFQMGGGEVIGYCRNVRLYKTNGNQSAKIYSTAHATSGYTQTGQLSGSEIPGAFGSNGYTASNSNSDTTETVRSIDIKDYISNGNNTLFINTTDSTNSSQMNTADANSKTGAIQMTVDVIGYMSFESTNNQNLEEEK